MRGKTFFVYMLWIIAILGAFQSSYAEDPRITVTVEVTGQTCPMIPAADGTVVIAADGGSYTCGTYTIRPKTTGLGGAKVQSVGDGAADTLTLSNAKISRSAASSPDLHITFSAGNFVDPPASGDPVDVEYEVTAAGFFKKDLTNNLAVDSYIKTRGFIQHPSGDPNPWFMLGSNPPSSSGIQLEFTVCGTGGCSNYIPTTYNTDTRFTALSNTRVLKGEFWVKLNASNEMLFLNALQVHNTTGIQPCNPEADENCAPRCHPKECVKYPKIPRPTGGFLNWICETTGFFCDQ